MSCPWEEIRGTPGRADSQLSAIPGAS
jgi:hypothetical protein